MLGPQPWPLPAPPSNRIDNTINQAAAVLSGPPGLTAVPAPRSSALPSDKAAANEDLGAPGREVTPTPRTDSSVPVDNVASNESDSCAAPSPDAAAESTVAASAAAAALAAAAAPAAAPSAIAVAAPDKLDDVSQAESSAALSVVPSEAPAEAAALSAANVASCHQTEDAKPQAVEATTGTSSSSSNASNNGGAGLSPDAPVFVPNFRGSKDGANGASDDDVLAILPPYHRAWLREGVKNEETGEWYPYFVGKLKSFSKSSGYGFVSCAQTYSQWGCDIFIHKSQVMTPWHLGQPCEFGIQVNSRGQPQACQVFWLPRLPEPKAQHGPLPSKSVVAAASSEEASSNGMKEPDAAAGSSSTDGNVEKSQPQASQKVVERFLGTLKSFSPAQGYGFISCDEFHARHKRDVYFDKSQLPASSYFDRHAVEFSVVYNKHGHPQARDIEWNPIPLGCKMEDNAAGARSFTPSTMERLRKLRNHLNKKELELAVIAAIDMQGQMNKAPGKDSETSPVDFVKYVLDRLAKPEEAVVEIKDFIRMLLLLMLAKMLRRPVNSAARTAQLVEWFLACSTHVEPNVHDESMKQFPQVVDQIKVNLQYAARENPEATRDSKVCEPLANAMRDLLAKAKTYGAHARKQ